MTVLLSKLFVSLFIAIATVQCISESSYSQAPSGSNSKMITYSGNGSNCTRKGAYLITTETTRPGHCKGYCVINQAPHNSYTYDAHFCEEQIQFDRSAQYVNSFFFDGPACTGNLAKEQLVMTLQCMPIGVDKWVIYSCTNKEILATYCIDPKCAHCSTEYYPTITCLSDNSVSWCYSPK